MRLIQAKLKGKQPTLQQRDTPQDANVVDLVARLRASLEANSGTAGKQTASKGTRKPAAQRKRTAP